MLGMLSPGRAAGAQCVQDTAQGLMRLEPSPGTGDRTAVREPRPHREVVKSAWEQEGSGSVP